MLITPNQTIQDVAIMATGTIETIFELVAANGGAITDDPVPGTDYMIPLNLLQNTGNLQYLQINDIIIGTLNRTIGKGIGTMRIGTDFIVS